MRARALVTGAAVLLLAGCSAQQTTAGSGDAGGSEIAGEATVYAAASLSAAFGDLAADFEERNPGTTISLVADGSSTLVTQLTEGAPADVLATADERSMQDAIDAGLVAEPSLFATNTLVIAVPAGNPAGIDELADLASATTVVCAPEVPCGAASATLLESQGVEVEAASLEQNVTSVLAKVAAGEADAGLVYATDVIGDDDVESIVPDGAADVVNRYPIAAVDGASDAGEAFAEFVLGDDGAAVLAEFGFGAP
ncbi:molybdate ABC transporter substrate-binding protein [Microbacterium halophytorum]|uniref:molybdate ABC transporter substrate-binding protein n=1 Tax=Microbacterium halophytorum TaxID=2067568 RepID=UPI000CFAE970|nr:molybdate ABC transporter substrate-binding protein [Microbacterium halophytorum]